MFVSAQQRRTLADWRPIEIGGWACPDTYKNTILAAGMKIGPSADIVLNMLTTSSRKIELTLALASFDDLRLGEEATFQDICRRGEDLGLQLCPAEVGPSLRLAYLDQPVGEWLLIAMKPLVVSLHAATDNDPMVFAVGNANPTTRFLEFPPHEGLYLDGAPARSEFPWYRSDGYQFVFSRPHA